MGIRDRRQAPTTRPRTIRERAQPFPTSPANVHGTETWPLSQTTLPSFARIPHPKLYQLESRSSVGARGRSPQQLSVPRSAPIPHIVAEPITNDAKLSALGPTGVLGLGCPQHTRFRSDFRRAHPLELSNARVVTATSGGPLVGQAEPQHATLLSTARTAHVLPNPTTTDSYVPVGVGSASRPQHDSVPSVRSAHATWASTESDLNAPAGGDWMVAVESDQQSICPVPSRIAHIATVGDPAMAE